MNTPQLNYVPCGGAAGPHRMACWQWGDAAAPHVVVCAHGLTRQGRDFDVLAQALLEASAGPLRVLCPDVAGRGRSDWLTDAAHYQVPTYVADMLALLAAEHARAPITTLDWFGTSMGGLIGMGLCGTPGLPLPVPVRRLVLNDVGPVIEWQALARIGAYVGQTGRFRTLQEVADALAAISQGFGPHTPEQWLALSAPMVRTLPDGALTLHYDPALATPLKALTREAAEQGQAALWALYDAITARTLLVRGAESDLLSRQTAQQMTQRGPRATLIELAGVGHAPTFVTPDQVAPVAAFLLQQDAAHEDAQQPVG